VNPEDELVEAGRNLQRLMVASVPERVKQHVHDALHHMTLAVLALDTELTVASREE
jgi:hypothetical protein